MASWLKVAEDLFEVVDRRAKLVASELTEEQAESEPSASKGQETQARRAKPKHKAQSRRSSIDLRRSSTDLPRINTTGDQSTAETSLPRDADDKIQASQSDNLVEVPIIAKETSSDPPVDVTEDTSQTTAPSFSSAKIPQKDSGEDVPNKVKELSVSVDNLDSGTSKIGDSSLENSKDGVDDPSYIPAEDNAESTNGDHTADANRKDSSANNDPSLKVDEKKNDSGKVDSSNVSTLQANDADLVLEYPSNLKKLHEHQTDTSPMRVQDQLDEAQGLLKTAVSTGQSKEARLARVCAGLSSRLQEYKSENAQLEELLVAERELSTSYQAHIKQLQKELTASKSEVARVESSMSGALAAKNAEIEALLNSVDALKKQAAASEGKLLSLQENMEVVMRSRELTETRMMQALREELASAERRAEEERTAHNATKMAAVEREVELEHRAVEASNALARMQRSADESTSRAAELEHKVALLEVECSSLTQELQEMEARARRGQKKTSEEANQILQMQAWQEEAERARQGQRDAESKLSSLEAEMQKMRVEMAGMRRDAEHYSRHEHMELEKRYRELTDLLYHKQTQLEAMASEKAAAEFQLEKELRRLQEAQVEVERSRSSRRASSPWEEDSDLKTLEPLPLHHRHIAGARIQLEKAAKLLDSGAVRATRFLWRYPYARVILLFYLVFVHLFLMYLLHRLQEQADTFSASEVAASMGLRNSSLP